MDLGVRSPVTTGCKKGTLATYFPARRELKLVSEYGENISHSQSFPCNILSRSKGIETFRQKTIDMREVSTCKTLSRLKGIREWLSAGGLRTCLPSTLQPNKAELYKT